MPEITIRGAEPADYEALFTFIQRILDETGAQKAPIFSPELWRWQCQTPGFDTLAVVAKDGAEVVGSYHLVSRDMWYFDQPRTMVLLQDLGVHPDYRRHGVFVQMSDYAVSEAAARGWDVTYSFPNHRSYPGFIKKQSYRHVDTVPVYVRPLDVGQILAERLPLRALWRMLGGTVMLPYDGMFRWRAAEAIPIERFSGDVDALSRQFVKRAGMGCKRDAAFLNWRFLDKPTHEYHAWGRSQQNRLRAYLVTRRAHMFGANCLLLMDFGCADGADDDLRGLIAARLMAERREGMALAVTMGLHPFFGQLRRLGFIRVPNRLNPRPLNFIVRGHTHRVSDDIYDAKKWFTTLADWDVL
jgi:predicted N-acetyltransferase YhbS